MDWLTKLLERVKKQRSLSEDWRQIAQYALLGRLEQPVIYPFDFMEELMVAIVLQSKKQMHVSSTDIKLYNMFDIKTGNFICSFYALCQNDTYYGYMVGTTEIIACDIKAFRFEETNELFVPLAGKAEKVFALICDYNRLQGSLNPLRFVQTDVNRSKDTTLHLFPQETDMDDAVLYCSENIKL